MTRVDIQIDDSEISRRLAQLLARAGDLRPALADIGQHLRNSTEDRFDTQTDPEGNAWAPLSKSYLRRKRGTKILTETSRLRDSIVPQVDSDGLGVSVGTNVKYARIHQFGGVIEHKGGVRELLFRVDKKTGQSRFSKRRKANFAQDVTVGPYSIPIPARPYLGVSNQDRTVLLKILSNYLGE